jgi:hypothetical protein
MSDPARVEGIDEGGGGARGRPGGGRAQAEHLALPLDERLRRGWRLFELYRHRLRSDDAADDAAQFYARARQLGCCDP